ncbi:unnamed protein product, partial [Prorocentrum cordatum]
MGPHLPEGGLLNLYIDELAPARETGGSRWTGAAREVFLQRIPPLHTYSNVEFKTWLGRFGEVDDVTLILLPGPVRRPTGSAYARFVRHEDAAALIAAHPVRSRERPGFVDRRAAQIEAPECRWSLSERLQQGPRGNLVDAGVLGSLRARVRRLRGSAEGCPSLAMAGDGCGETQETQALGPTVLEGPLRFSWRSADTGGEAPEALRAGLAR